MGNLRTTQNYHFKLGNKVTHIGVTTNLTRREHEHKRKLPERHIGKVVRRVSRYSALGWKRKTSR